MLKIGAYYAVMRSKSGHLLFKINNTNNKPKIVRGDE